MKKTTSIKFVLLLLVVALSFGLVHNGVDAQAQSATGVRSVQSFFSATDNVTLTPNTDTPSYVAKQANGLLVTSGESGTVYYNNPIDATTLTKDDLLFGLQITPKVSGRREMTQIIVRLQDVDNPKIFMEISLYRYDYEDVALDSIVFITVKTDTIESFRSCTYQNDYDSKNDENHVTMIPQNGLRGCQVYGSFAGTKRGYSNSINLFFDNETMTLYSKDYSTWPDKSLYKTGFADEDGKFKVLDLDSDEMGNMKKYRWGGFPSGKFTMSFTTQLLNEDYANYMILAINNQNMDGTLLNDVTAPVLTVDAEQGNLPTAVVGGYYPFFNCLATDAMYGNLPVQTKVTFDGNEYLCNSNGFVPDKIGDYTLIYSASDPSGNTTAKQFTVTAGTTVAELDGSFVFDQHVKQVRFDDTSAQNPDGSYPIDLFCTVYLPKMSGSGGSGQINCTLAVEYLGKNVELSDNGFVATQGGIYNVTYTLTDYLGNSKKYSYALQATLLDKPVLQDVEIQQYLTVGQTYLLPSVKSYYFAPWGQQIKTFDQIKIYAIDGTTLLYTLDGNNAVYSPIQSDGEQVIVEYCSAVDSSSQPATYRKTVNLINGNALSDKFVCDDGVTVTPTNYSIDFGFASESQSVLFVNPVSILNGVEFGFTTTAGKNNFAQLDVKFTDRDDKSKTLTVSIFRNNVDVNRCEICANGGVKGTIFGTFFDASNDLTFVLMRDGTVFDSNDDLVASATGFDGFFGGFVYVEFSAKGVTGESVISLKKLATQTVSNVDTDYKKPSIYVVDEMIGNASYGSRVYVSPAIASDVYNVKTSLKVTVTFNNATVFQFFNEFGNFDGGYFFASDYGTYRIRYEATDSNDNSISKYYQIVVRDEVKPQLVINGNVPTTAKKGDKLTLPQVTATDNVDGEVTVYLIVIDPMNVYTVVPLSEGYTFGSAGRYVVKLYCEDSNYNYRYSERYTINVTL